MIIRDPLKHCLKLVCMRSRSKTIHTFKYVKSKKKKNKKKSKKNINSLKMFYL